MATVCSVASLLCPDMATQPRQMSANGCINYYSRESEREREIASVVTPPKIYLIFI